MRVGDTVRIANQGVWQVWLVNGSRVTLRQRSTVESGAWAYLVKEVNELW